MGSKALNEDGVYRWFVCKIPYLSHVQVPIVVQIDKLDLVLEENDDLVAYKSTDSHAKRQWILIHRQESEVFRDDGGTNTAKLSKNEIMVWLKLSDCQCQLYEAFLSSEIVLSAFDGSPLAALTILKKICDHPLLLTKRAAEDLLNGMETGLNQEDQGVAEKLAMHIADAAERYDIGENHDILSCKISFIMSSLDREGLILSYKKNWDYQMKNKELLGNSYTTRLVDKQLQRTISKEELANNKFVVIFCIRHITKCD